MATTPESQISLRFVVRPAVFELQAILTKSAQIDPQMTLSTKRSKISIHI